MSFIPQCELYCVPGLNAIAEVLITAGLNETLAKQRGEDAVIAVQGVLILSHELNDFTPFERVIKQLPQQLCTEDPTSKISQK